MECFPGICPQPPPNSRMPPRAIEMLCLLLIGVVLPTGFLFELIFVVPVFHEPGSFWHIFTIALSVFLYLNVQGNWLACMLTDTSVEFKILQPPEQAAAHGWRHCIGCDKWTPPRSWHCAICRRCILKRDHHCLYTGGCVGHRNHRYFMLFIFYFFIGACYAFVYNSIYLWVLHGDVYLNWVSLGKLILLPLILHGDFRQNVYLVLYHLNFMALVLNLLMLNMQMRNALRGNVCYESAKGMTGRYDVGWRRNLKEVFGKRMQLVWLCPLIRSELPQEGDEWKAIEANEDEEALTTTKQAAEEVDAVKQSTTYLNINEQINSSAC